MLAYSQRIYWLTRMMAESAGNDWSAGSLTQCRIVDWNQW